MQVDDAQPSPRRRVIRPARKVASSIGLGLEHTFEKVSMTPPARLPIDQTESPFVRLPHVVEFPATEIKRQALPRSQAFGPFAPLHGSKSFLYNDDGDGPQTRPNHKALLQRTVTLQNHVRRASHSASSDEIEGDLDKASDVGRFHVGLPASPSSFSLASTSVSASEGVVFADSTSLHPRRRRTATTPARAQARSNRRLHGDRTVSGDSSPNSYTDGSSFALRADEDYSDQENGSADSESDDINTLRPGASFSRRRMSGVHGISKSHHRQQTAPAPMSTLTFGGEPMARANTTSSICECGCGSTCHSASITASSSKFDDSLHVRHPGKIEDSPFKTPNKRRARMQGSSSSLPRRNYSTASPIAPPADSEEGTLFGSSSSSSVNREGGDALDSTPLRASNVKRRSVGSLSHWQDISQYQHQPLSSVKKSLSALSSIPRASRTTLPRLSSEAEYTHDSPSHFAFDDSGVALQSPATYNTPLEKRNDVSFAKGPLRASLRGSEEISASPSKLAASRRQLLDMQPTKISNKLSNGVHERSSLSNETRFSDECSSVNTTPDIRRKFSTAASVPEQLVSPQQTKNRSRSSHSSSSLAVECETAPYLTPQTYKNVVPLQAAFMSTGLASKRSRPTFGNVDSLTGEPLPPLPAKLNYGNLSSKHSFHSSGNIAASLGLRDVVAAANAHAAAAANTSTPSAMPDTPMKRPIASFGGSALKGIPTRSRFKATLSPSSNDGNDSSSGGSMYGADSPLLNQDCGSPTLGLSSMDADRFRSPAAMLDAGSWKHSESSAINSSSENHGAMQSAPSPKIVESPSKLLQRQRSFVRQSLPNQARGNEDSLRTQVMRPMSLHRPPLGLQRKSSFGPAADQANPLSAHSPLFDVIPSTPTRHSSTIKWYEAAQLVSTPSPSHRHHGSDSSRRESWQTIGSMRGRPQRNDSANSTSMLVPAAPVRQYNGERAGYFETRFTVQGTLGKGVFSQVDKVEDKTDGLLYAVKRMKKAYQGTRDRIRRLEEVDILRSLGKDGDHPNIVTFIDAWEESRHLFIQTELCPCVDFSSFLQHFSNMGGSLDEARLWKVMCELKNGLGYIHDANILHLDLKPANIFITEIATLKIGDFGMATRWPPVDSKVVMAGASLGEDRQYELNKDVASVPPASRSIKSLEREGDREYIAPEIIHRGEYSRAADVFSLGLVMLEAACNVVLPDNGEPWQKLRNDDFSDVDLSQFTPSLVRLICSCLASDPSKRPSVATLDEHPVLQAVSKRVAMGVEMSELDQLPIFDFPNSESSKSLSKKPMMKCSKIEQVEDQQESTDTEMTTEGQDDEMVPCTPKPFAAPSMADESRLRSNLVADSSIDGQAGFIAMERTGSGRSALGLEGVEEHEKVLDVRGALIYENLDFLISVLEAERGSSWDPTGCHALPDAVDLPIEAEYSHGGDHSVPSISIHGEEDSDTGAFMSGGQIIRANCASPLSRLAPDCDTDMDD